jgi:calcium-dependent protein kinase
LFDRIKSMNHFSEKKAAEIIKQILMAVVYCHGQSIVHRDLKPENLLFVSPDENSKIKIIDFGTSRKFDPKKRMTKRLGTPYYIAPEVLLENYNEKCDVWSCGVILFILLCGYPPFSGRTEDDILQRVKSGKFSFDRIAFSNCSRGLVSYF